jgi:hypothetical protein
MTTRLATVAPELNDEIQSSTAELQRLISVAVAAWIATEVDLDDQRAVDAVLAIRGGKVGESPIRSRMAELVEELDVVAWDLQDTVEQAGSGGDDPAYLEAFARARAADALWCALSNEPLEAAIESAYEAQAARRDLEGLRKQVRSVLG